MLVAACVLHDLVIIPVLLGQQGVEVIDARSILLSQNSARCYHYCQGSILVIWDGHSWVHADIKHHKYLY